MPGKRSASCRDGYKRLREENQTLAAELEEQREQSAFASRDEEQERRTGAEFV